MSLTRTLLCAALAAGLIAPAAAAQTKVEGTVAAGGIFVDETGDRATMVETYNIFDGFSLSQIRLNATFNPKSYLSFNLREINLDSRKGELVYRLTDRLRVTSNYDQWRQIFDPDASITSDRKDWRTTLQVQAGGGAVINANYDLQHKSGDGVRLSGDTPTTLTDGFDYNLHSGMVEADVTRGRGTVALAYNFAKYDNDVAPVTNRFGQILSARAYTSKLIWPDRFTNMLRAAWGKQEIKDSGLNYKLWQFQYTGVIRPYLGLQAKYNFDYNRIDDQGTGYITDDIRNNVELAYYTKYGQVYGAYCYETNDDDIALTRYNTFLVGASGSYAKRISATVEYGTRTKDDQGMTTLLKDIDTDKFLAKLRVQIIKQLYLGGKVQQRKRDFTTIGVSAEGNYYNVYGGFDYMGWGSLVGDYTYSTDDYDDLVGDFTANSKIATARLQIDRIKGLVLVGGATYLDVSGDLSIEKSIMFFEGKYMLPKNLFVEAKYNIYNYDDYIVTSRYYTANVVWLNVGYNFKNGKIGPE